MYHGKKKEMGMGGMNMPKLMKKSMPGGGMVSPMEREMGMGGKMDYEMGGKMDMGHGGDLARAIKIFLMKKGGKTKFPDLTGDGKVTFADILKGRLKKKSQEYGGKVMQNGGVSDPRKDPSNRRSMAELPNEVMEDLLPFLEGEEAFEVAEARRAASQRRSDRFAVDFSDDLQAYGPGRPGDEDVVLESAQLRQDFGLDDFQKAYLSPNMRKVALSFLDRLNPRNLDRDVMRLATLESADLGKAVADDSPEMAVMRLAYYASQNPDSIVAEKFRDRAKRMGL